MLRNSIRLIPLVGISLALGSTSTLASSKACGDFLSHITTYSCTVTPSIGTAFHDCFVASGSGGSFSGEFSVLAIGFGIDCVCNATGTPSRPKLQSSRTNFVCNSANSLAFEGKLVAAGKKITHGNAVDKYGTAYSLTCEQVTSCSP